MPPDLIPTMDEAEASLAQVHRSLFYFAGSCKSAASLLNLVFLSSCSSSVHSPFSYVNDPARMIAGHELFGRYRYDEISLRLDVSTYALKVQPHRAAVNASQQILGRLFSSLLESRSRSRLKREER